jgi:hypothetical protein
MRRAWISGVTLVATAALGGGCAALFSSGGKTVQSDWESFEEAKAAFDQIIPGVSTVEDLECLNLDPFTQPNVRILTYLDIIHRFMPNDSIRLEDLPDAVRDCIQAREKARAYEINVTVSRSRRYGTLFLDVLGFHRKSRETGWTFQALLLVKDDVVTYKLWSGQPGLEVREHKTKPLGPFQELDSIVTIPIPR